MKKRQKNNCNHKEIAFNMLNNSINYQTRKKYKYFPFKHANSKDHLR